VPTPEAVEAGKVERAQSTPPPPLSTVHRAGQSDCGGKDDSMNFIIRTAEATDVGGLRGLLRRSSLSNEGDRDRLLADGDALGFSEDGVREERTRVAVDAVGTILGFSTYLVTGDIIELEDLFVDPPWMRQGVGSALVRDVVSSALALSFERLEVTANPHALAFYERVGFVADHEVETQFYRAPRMHLVIPS
jgi:GNAT superfamily N-acetyltransferase